MNIQGYLFLWFTHIICNVKNCKLLNYLMSCSKLSCNSPTKSCTIYTRVHRDPGLFGKHKHINQLKFCYKKSKNWIILIFDWWKVVWKFKGALFEWHLNTKLKFKSSLFAHCAYCDPNIGLKRPIFRCSSLPYYYSEGESIQQL